MGLVGVAGVVREGDPRSPAREFPHAAIEARQRREFLRRNTDLRDEKSFELTPGDRKAGREALGRYRTMGRKDFICAFYDGRVCLALRTVEGVQKKRFDNPAERWEQVAV